jgi:pimeloyl-ACP methyl ester carboxylesterase
MFLQEWKKEHPDYLSYLPPSGEPINPKTVQLQSQAVVDWKGTCDRLPNISKPTLVIDGTDDIFVPPANSKMIAQKIPGTWLVQIKGAGHGLMYQYPQQFTAVLETFLSITN